jgi:hypothetical protein
MAMRVTWTRELDTMTGETSDALENWMEAVAWLLFAEETETQDVKDQQS